MNGLRIFFSPGEQTEIQVTAPAMRYFRGERAGNYFVALLALLAHAYLDGGQAFSAATSTQIAAETGLSLRDVRNSLQVLARDGWFTAVTLPDGRPGYHIHLNQTRDIPQEEGDPS